MTKKERELRDEIKNLKAELRVKTNELYDIREDRRKFREHFELRFKLWIKLLGEKRSPNMEWLVEDDARWLARFQTWFW